MKPTAHLLASICSEITVMSLIALALVAAPLPARAASSAHARLMRERVALSALDTIAASRSCGPNCQAAYRVVAAALPSDRTNVLAKAILATADFDYIRLTLALHIPTIPEIRTRWREWCNRKFPRSHEPQRLCFELILGPPWLNADPDGSLLPLGV